MMMMMIQCLVLSFMMMMIDVTLAVSSCSECVGPDSCLVDNPDTVLSPGASRLALTICRFDRDRKYEFEFIPDHIPSCDAQQVTKPIQSAIHMSDSSCSLAACTLEIEFDQPIDSAIALRYESGQKRNQLKARLSVDEEPVRVAQFASIPAPSVIESQMPVSACTNSFHLGSPHLSIVPECNRATVCLARENSNECQDTIASAAPVSITHCQAGFCRGLVQLTQELTCQVADSSTPFIIAQLQVADAGASAFTQTSKVARLASELESVVNLAAGRQEFLIRGKHLCPNGELTISTDSIVPVPSVGLKHPGNASAVGLQLDQPLDFAAAHASYALEVETCGIKSNALVHDVGGGDGPPTIQSKNVLLKRGSWIELDVEGTGFSAFPEHMNATLAAEKSSTGSNSSVSLVLPAVSIVQASSVLLRLNSTRVLPDDTPVGTTLVLHLEIVTNGVTAVAQPIGTICDDIAVSCSGGDAARREDHGDRQEIYTQERDGAAGLGTGIYAAIAIGVVAVIGIAVEFKMHRKRQLEAAEAEQQLV